MSTGLKRKRSGYLVDVFYKNLTELSRKFPVNFSRALNGFIFAVAPFPDEEAPPSWTEAIKLYEQEIPTDNRCLFTQDEISNYDELYSKLIQPENQQIINRHNSEFIKVIELFTSGMN